MKLEVISEVPKPGTGKVPVLFVHGMWHGAWCWGETFVPYFARRGHPAHALSLRGHCGSESDKSLAWTTLADYVQDVARVAGELGTSPVVVGHSMGGAVVQRYLEAHRAPAGVLLAACPPNGVAASCLRYLRRHPLPFLGASLTTRLYGLVGTHALAKEALFSADMPDEEVARHFGRLQDEAYLAFLRIIGPGVARPARIACPVMVLGAEEDIIITPRQVRSTARAYGTQAHLFPGMAHDMMLEKGWQAVADRIIDWLEEQRVRPSRQPGSR